MTLIYLGLDLGYLRGAEDHETTRLQLKGLPPSSEASSTMSTKSSANMDLKDDRAHCKNQLHVPHMSGKTLT